LPHTDLIGAEKGGILVAEVSRVSVRRWSLFAVLRQVSRQPTQRIALVSLAIFAVIALFADMLASSQPLLLSFRQHLYILPNLTHPRELRLFDNDLLVRNLGRGDWAILPLVPWGFNGHDLSHVLSAPDAVHWLGTDGSGRDVLARTIHGARVSLIVGVLSVTVLVAVGTTLGTLAGYFGGLIDVLLMRMLEIVHSIPTILLLVTLLSLLAPEGYSAVVAMTLVIGFVWWTDVARLIRGEILRVKELDFVVAARAQGSSTWNVIFRHVLPNASSPVLVSATFALASAILVEGALSFLGYGIPDDMASWGGLLNEVRSDIGAWWLAVFPGAAIFSTVTAFNLVGEGLRDAFDPRTRR
jgi:peptide/nickel transport system permease protein